MANLKDLARPSLSSENITSSKDSGLEAFLQEERASKIARQKRLRAQVKEVPADEEPVVSENRSERAARRRASED